MAAEQSRPLEGIRVLDLTVALAGPYGSMMLGGMGAEVIRVEAPGGGDIARTNPPFVGGQGIHFGKREDDEVSLTILNRARNKKSITLDLKSEHGRELFMRLVEESDVVIENYSEGTTAKLGVDYERVRQRNPRIVYASIKAMGEPSAFPGLKGMDIIVQALSGIMEVTGYADGPPTRCGLPIADLVTPMYAVNGILAALIHRGRTGVGQRVQVSMLDCLASWVAEEHFDVMGREGYPSRTGNYHDRLAPFGVYQTRDGHVAIVAFQPDWMRGLLDAVGQPELLDDPRFSTRGPRMRNASELNAVIEAWTRQHSTREVVGELLDKRGVPCAPVRTPTQVLHDRRLHDSGAVMDLVHPEFGPIGAVGMGLPIRFSATPSQFDQPAMALGAANAEIYGGLLKLSPQEIAALEEVGVV
ncbi:CaiB/BaiF CoA transferase family protein [Cupriavidus numazuensis]|uniref:Formyl-CoA:oxalate CoA-transferase n=1 Tax=Cupriavidus numazuensis TaxID=221992 RepID=A0ABM8THV1_9BURK|nr:CoA transferase [Cupriavidus numazuensis]CAG2147276.1 Formyl-CoA:oxalate CoA-transferase [Cupriavidus numazuensis]